MGEASNPSGWVISRRVPHGMVGGYGYYNSPNGRKSCAWVSELNMQALKNLITAPEMDQFYDVRINDSEDK